MTSVLKTESNPTKNGIILKESTKKFVEATSTSGCDSEMSEITSSIPSLLTIKSVNVDNVAIADDDAAVVVDIVDSGMKDFVDTKLVLNICETSKSTTPIHFVYEIEDIIDGFSIFSFVSDEDLASFSIKHEKLETVNESDSNNKNKKMGRSKKQSKFKNAKESSCNDGSLDIYDFQANSESSPSSKHSSLIFKKSTAIKNHSNKFIRKSKYKFKSENNSSLSEENSSNTSVTESQNLSFIDVHNDSPQPTSNDDNNVVSTTTPDTLNIDQRKSDLTMNNSEKIRSPVLKTASLRLFKLEDELTLSTHGHPDKNPLIKNLPVSGSDNDKVLESSQLRLPYSDEKFQSKNIPTKFSVDLLTTVTEKKAVEKVESNLCLKTNSSINNNLSTFQNPSETADIPNNLGPSLSITSRSNHQKSADSNNTYCQKVFTESAEMCSTGLKPPSSMNCHSSPIFGDPTNTNNHYMANDDDNIINNINHSNKIINEKVINPALLSYHKDIDTSQNTMASWLNSQFNKSLYNNSSPGQHKNVLQGSNGNSFSLMPPKAAHNYGNSLKSSTANANQNSTTNILNTKLPHDATFEWPNNYFDNAKILRGSMQKYNSNVNSFNYDLTSNMRFQQEQQDLMNSLRLKHENAKISKPLVQLGLESMYKIDPSTFKNTDSSFPNPNPNAGSFFLPNSQLPIDFNSANVFKSRSDQRSSHNCNETLANKSLQSLSTTPSSNFKTPETTKRRSHWCDMHVKIAYFIYRSQKRLSLTKSQDVNSQLPHLIFADKISSLIPPPSITQYPNSLLQHSNPYFDLRSSTQPKNDTNYLNYHSKPSASFPNNLIRPLNNYPYVMPQNMDLDIPPTNPLDDHHQTAEQKWMRLLNQYMTNHPLSNLDRPNIDAINQFYLWCQQFNQANNPLLSSHFNQTIPTSPLQTQNLDTNSMYLRKYMEQLSSYLGSLKNEGNSYINNAMADRDMHILLMKQQLQQQQQQHQQQKQQQQQQHNQYQKAMLSKYQSTINKSVNIPSHLNPLINSFYSKMKPLNPDPIIPHYSDCNSSLLNHKYRLTQDQNRQMKCDQLSSHHLKNGYSKPVDSNNINVKRRKLNSELTKSYQVDLLTSGNREGTKPSDLSPDIGANTIKGGSLMSVNNNANNRNSDNRSSNSRDNSSFHLQTTVAPESRE